MSTSPAPSSVDYVAVSRSYKNVHCLTGAEDRTAWRSEETKPYWERHLPPEPVIYPKRVHKETESRETENVMILSAQNEAVMEQLLGHCLPYSILRT